MGKTPNIVMTGKNVGDLLNAAGVSWGWFYGDFAPVSTSGGVATCTSIYNSHYAPFDYYLSTSNPHHIPPDSLAAIGTDTCTNQMCANHTYVDHSLNDTTSIPRFIESNWDLGTIGDPQSFDVLASGTIMGMFDFDPDHDHRDRKLIFDPTMGQVIGPSGRQ